MTSRRVTAVFIILRLVSACLCALCGEVRVNSDQTAEGAEDAEARRDVSKYRDAVIGGVPV
jgi:hypothetical protein